MLSSTKYDLYPDFPGLHALVPQWYKRMKPYTFFLEREDRIVRTTPSGVRIVSTRIRKFIFCVVCFDRNRLHPAKRESEIGTTAKG